MPKYTEVESLLKTAKKLSEGVFSTPLIIAAIENAPTVDVVEVVRCKDCKHFLNDTDYCQRLNKGYCVFDNIIKSKNHFCGYGERMVQTNV
jgi:hypothetical protein